MWSKETRKYVFSDASNCRNFKINYSKKGREFDRA